LRSHCLGLRPGLGLGGGLVLARAAAIAFDRAAATEHHGGVILLRGAGHHGGEMLEGVAVGAAERGGEIDVAAELEHAIVVALEHGLGLLRRQPELLQVFRLVRLEGLPVVVLHQRHAEHVDAEPLARALGVEHERPRDIVIVLLRACHWPSPLTAARLLRNRRPKLPLMSSASHSIAQTTLATYALVAELSDSNSSKAASGCRPGAASAAPAWSRYGGCGRPARRRRARPSSCSDAANRCPTAPGRGTHRPGSWRMARRRHRAGRRRSSVPDR